MANFDLQAEVFLDNLFRDLPTSARLETLLFASYINTENKDDMENVLMIEVRVQLKDNELTFDMAYKPWMSHHHLRGRDRNEAFSTNVRAAWIHGIPFLRKMISKCEQLGLHRQYLVSVNHGFEPLFLLDSTRYDTMPRQEAYPWLSHDIWYIDYKYNILSRFNRTIEMIVRIAVHETSREVMDDDDNLYAFVTMPLACDNFTLTHLDRAINSTDWCRLVRSDDDNDDDDDKYEKIENKEDYTLFSLTEKNFADFSRREDFILHVSFDDCTDRYPGSFEIIEMEHVLDSLLEDVPLDKFPITFIEDDSKYYFSDCEVYQEDGNTVSRHGPCFHALRSANFDLPILK